MAVPREKKKELLEKLKQIIKTAPSVVFANFKGVSVSDTNSMRRTLKEKGVNYMVAKKTVAKIALKDSSIGGTEPPLEGEFALAWSADLLDSPRELYSFQKKFENKVSILGGIFEGAYIGKEEMIAIASIPSLQTLQAQFVNLINSPIQGFVMALDAIAKKKEA